MRARVLIIEDNPANMELMSYLLAAAGHATTEAWTGEQGLELASQSAPDLVLCDLALPGIDGYAVASRLKGETSLAAVPIIAVTASAMVGDRDKVLAAGFDGYISKPITPETFATEVERFLPRRAPMATILVVDDLATNREVLVTLLGYQGHRMIEAADGSLGLAAARAERPDLIITDILMPVMDGYELVRQLRLDPATRSIPVIFYTAHYSQREARALSLSQGVSEILTKPAEAEEVLRIVARALDRGTAGGGPVEIRAEDSQFEREHLRLLTDKLFETADDLRATNARLRALINIDLDLASERDSEGLLRRVCASACDLFGASYASLGILAPDGRTVERFVASGAPAADWTAPGERVNGLLARVVRERRAVRGEIPDGQPDRVGLPRLHPEATAYVAAPVASPTHVYGWLCLSADSGRTFSDEDEQLVVALAGQVGRVYENGYFHSLAQQRADALRVERDRAQRYLDTATVILLALDLDKRVTLVNRYACDLLEWTADELQGRDWIETCVPERLRESLKDTLGELLSGSLPAGEYPVLTKSGQERIIEWRNTVLRDDAGDITSSLSSGADITERHALELQVRQAQKMEAVGRLAGGVAHDFNNLLTVILGHCELLLPEFAEDDRRRVGIAEIQRAGNSAARLTRQLLTFSRREIVSPRVVDLNEIVVEVRALLGRLIGEDISIALDLLPRPARIKADRGQLEQVLVNLAVNARDAMAQGGTLTISTAEAELDAARVANLPGATAGHHVVLSVSDTGVGMTQDVQSHLFEPFFTTKEPGKGTGLGLATVHAIVQRAGGHLLVESEIDRGSTFRIYLPSAVAPDAMVAATSPASRPRDRTQTVLVVEDAHALRELTRQLLEREGYRVLTAANASEALLHFEGDPGIDAVLTDVVMPGASGPELTRQLMKQRPGLKVIYMSGYNEEAILRHGIAHSSVAFLQKPFTSEALGRKLREVLV